MNLWQSNASENLAWPRGGRAAKDTNGRIHTSIHPAGRSQAYRDKQRKKFHG